MSAEIGLNVSGILQPDLLAPLGLTWSQVDAYHLASACGRYTVSRAFSRKVVTYQAWRRAKPVAELLGTFLYLDDARACAAAHAETNP
jgi:hypothetical protein